MKEGTKLTVHSAKWFAKHLDSRGYYFDVRVTPSMQALAGKQATVIRVPGEDYFRIDLDDEGFFWRAWMFKKDRSQEKDYGRCTKCKYGFLSSNQEPCLGCRTKPRSESPGWKPMKKSEDIPDCCDCSHFKVRREDYPCNQCRAVVKSKKSFFESAGKIQENCITCRYNPVPGHEPPCSRCSLCNFKSFWKAK